MVRRPPPSVLVRSGRPGWPRHGSGLRKDTVAALVEALGGAGWRLNSGAHRAASLRRGPIGALVGAELCCGVSSGEARAQRIRPGFVDPVPQSRYGRRRRRRQKRRPSRSEERLTAVGVAW